MSSPSVADPIASARGAFERHEWQEAFDLLSTADESGTLTGDELVLFADAAWWAGRFRSAISARERAFARFTEGGEKLKAAKAAINVGSDHFKTMARSISAGWYARAQRLLDEEPESVEHGFLAVDMAWQGLVMGEPDGVLERASAALDIGTRFGSADLVAMALLIKGQALVASGQVKEGLALQDEASLAAVSGELEPLTTGIVYCGVIAACSSMADYRRAGEWTEAATRWCERQSISGFPGICRVHRAEIMRLRGSWVDARDEAQRACVELTDFGFHFIAADAFYELGEIRLRMGEPKLAEEAFRQANEMGREPMPGMALIRLAEGKMEAASKLIGRALGETKDGLGRARLLPAAVEIALARGDLDMAQEGASEMERLAEEYGTDAMGAAAACARAQVHLKEGDAEGALRSAREGLRLWQTVEAPYESALARVCIGLAYRLQDDEEAASLELGAARGALEKLGAATDVRRVDALLEEQSRADGPRVVRTFMFTDIERSTNLVEAIGDAAWENLVGWHDRTLRSLFVEHGGEEISHAGDGFFVAFEDPRVALECAMAIQRSLAEHGQAHGFAPRVRIGVHVSEATQRTDDYGGRGVHEAARIGSVGEGGEIVASVETIEAAGPGWEVSEPREITLKGISAPAKVVSVSWRPGEHGSHP